MFWSPPTLDDSPDTFMTNDRVDERKWTVNTIEVGMATAQLLATVTWCKTDSTERADVPEAGDFKFD